MFLEESDPYVYDTARKNQQAMDAAQEMLSSGGYLGYPPELAGLQVVSPSGLLPQLDPQGGGAGPS